MINNYFYFANHDWNLVKEYNIDVEIPIDEETLEDMRNEIIEDGEEPEEFYPFYSYYERCQTFINPEKNICLVFCQIRDETEIVEDGWLDESCDVIDFTFGDNYNNLVKYIESHNNFTVYWTQVAGTTADYVIIEDCYIYNGSVLEFDKKIKDIISTATKNDCGGYKYTIIKNGVMSKFTNKNI